MRLRMLLLVLCLMLWPLCGFAQVQPAPSQLNFQGRLTKPDGTPVANGNYSVRFSLWTALSGGTEKWNQVVNPVRVRNGTFAVLLNVAAPTDLFNTNLWLEIKIGTAAPLTPRQQLTSVAFALKANTVPDNAITAAKIANGAITGADIANGTITADKLATGATGWLLGGNAGTTTSHFLGTIDNKPLHFRSNNRRVLRIEDKVDTGNTYHTVNVLGGAAINNIEAGVIGATIAGGGQDNNSGLDSPNDVRGNFGTIGGGSANFIDAYTFGTIAGGVGNIVQGHYATVGGGANNIPAAAYATIGGGSINYIFGSTSTIGGGSNNSIGGVLSAITGGDSNTITGDVSVIGGGYLNANGGSYAVIGGGNHNVSTSHFGTISGGSENEATGIAATVAGGFLNNGYGPYAAIGGGSSNTVNGNTGTIAGGDQNIVGGVMTAIGGGRLNYGWNVSDYSVISGGFSNTVYGDFATIPGGYHNDADGLASFAGGYRAYAAHDGSFVWADAHEADFFSTAANQFCIRASGGIVFETFSHVPFYSGVGTGEANRYFLLLNSPRAASASGLKAGGILCADNFGWANPGKNNMAVKGTLGVGYPDPAPYTFAVNGSTYTATTYHSSDARWKTNITTLQNPLDLVLGLRGVTFDWKRDTPGMNFMAGKQVGFIAQEVEKVLPELVSTDIKGYKAVAYANVVPVLVEAVKTLKKNNDAVHAENAELKARLTALETAVRELQNQRK
jgi:trimeric autotransporter adhesin